MINLENINKVMIDTAPFIYLIEEHPDYSPKVEMIFHEIDNFRIEAITSVITLLEVLVQPIKLGKIEIKEKYIDILVDNTNIQLIDIDLAIAEKAAEIRATNKIKTPDSIQLACAILNDCDYFFTNDLHLKSFNNGINIISLDDL